mgnify:CR=1 FL=1
MPDIKKISYEIKNYKFIFQNLIYTIRYFIFIKDISGCCVIEITVV